MIRSVLLGIAAAIALAGCADYKLEKDGVEAVRAAMLDPESAQFRNVRVVANRGGGKLVCGEVNSKNRLGGYVGFQPFLVDGGDVMTPGTDQYTSFYFGCLIGAMCSAPPKPVSALDECKAEAIARARTSRY